MEKKDEHLGVPSETEVGLSAVVLAEDGSGLLTPIPHAKEDRGLDLTVYAIRKGSVYMVDPNGQKYKVPPIPGMPYHIGLRLTNVKFGTPKDEQPQP